MQIHIGSIPFKWKEKDLETLFEEYGTVITAKIVLDKMTRQNKGFGFVEMIDEEGEVAIRALNGKEFLGRKIMVTESKGRADANGIVRERTPKTKEDWVAMLHKEKTEAAKKKKKVWNK